MKAMTPGERKSFVRQAGLCDNCFGSGHVALNCGSKMKCQVNGCGWKHHTMLHLQKKNNDGNTPPNKPAATLMGMVPVSLAGPESLVVAVPQILGRRMFA